MLFSPDSIFFLRYLPAYSYSDFLSCTLIPPCGIRTDRTSIPHPVPQGSGWGTVHRKASRSDPQPCPLPSVYLSPAFLRTALLLSPIRPLSRKVCGFMRSSASSCDVYRRSAVTLLVVALRQQNIHIKHRKEHVIIHAIRIDQAHLRFPLTR